MSVNGEYVPVEPALPGELNPDADRTMQVPDASPALEPVIDEDVARRASEMYGKDDPRWRVAYDSLRSAALRKAASADDVTQRTAEAKTHDSAPRIADVWFPEPIELPEDFDAEIPEKMTADEIVAFKDELKGEGLEREGYRASISAAICLKMYTGRALEDQQSIADGDMGLEERTFKNQHDFTLSVARLTAHWNAALDRGLAVPGGEWPEHMSPPTVWVWGRQVLKHLKDKWGLED